MAIIDGLIKEKNGALSFGNYEAEEKLKVNDFMHLGDSYYVKSHKDVTKVERNDMFLYESVPGTVVKGFIEDEDTIEFDIEGFTDSQVTLGMLPDTEYDVFVDGNDEGKTVTNLGGKLTISVELQEGQTRHIKVTR